ncbi:MAG: isoleucine--tRNA ligase [Nitrospina sp.]|nr:isoleucine--tRNA ligase [Nitrospina sp.]
MDYKETLNLPVTDFPMKANLVQREPEMLERWDGERLYQKIREHSAGKKPYVFHDGPPYANGHIHMGHALNKILKDFIVKIKTMSGHDAGFIPGWDCHGLPIEHQVTKESKAKKQVLDKVEIRKLCREYAGKFIGIQRDEFKRLGVFADWEEPYLTMNFGYEAAIVREFTRFALSGMVYKGLKPVHWCTSCKTALAEAEVEYQDHKSPSIYVKFPVKSGWKDSIAPAEGKNLSLVIWTTTPWTLPANLAICLHPDFDYVAVAIGDDVYVVAEGRLGALILEWDVTDYKILGRCKGSELEGVVTQHPFENRESPVILGDHVTLEQGTGCVHTAPGHGQEDYVVGQKYGLETYNPVDDGGVFKADLPFFGGQFVTKANPEIIKKLREDGFLIQDSEIAHSYPHCWRCHQPIIFRATSQWFISMDSHGLRQKALSEIDKTQWVPAWGRDRIYGMVENRPDWCVSRQRAWGVPITIFTCTACEEPLVSKEVFDHVIRLTEEGGADFWFEKDVAEILPEDTACASCGSKQFKKEMDILDVWFDSGVSHAAVLEEGDRQPWPADLYLEGSDQHRGWFHSSLLESVGTRGKAPYRTVLTHGYVVDGKGKKMAKSQGNVIAPQKIIDQYGAEILRLWVASENYREDIRVSNEILKRLTEAYRKIRNTFRFLLGNLHDFDPNRDLVDPGDMEELDQYILTRFNAMTRRVRKAYDNFEFHVFYHTFYNFCVVDLSAFYLDIVKDRLYTYPRQSRGRRSAQTAMHHLLTGMTRLMAPILSFTAEEVWSFMPESSREVESVHLSGFAEDVAVDFPEEKARRWEEITRLRSEVSKALETKRRDKVIGHSLDARVTLQLPAELMKLFAGREEELQFIFIVSAIELTESLPEGTPDVVSAENMQGVKIAVSPAPGEKCERCWNYFVGSDAAEAESAICPRCVVHLESAGA